MRLLFLLWPLWFLCLPAIAPARAQPDEDAPSMEAAFVAEGLLRAVGLQFETGRSTLLPHVVPVLDAVAEVLVRHPSLRLEIAGHADALGPASLNARLSEDRARSVKEYLTVRHGIESDRLEISGYGSSVPIASNDSPTGRALNRRVEFRMLSPRDPPVASTEDVPFERTRRIDADSVREAVQRQVEEAVRTALRESDPNSDAMDRLAARERELQERLARIERQIAEDPVPTASSRQGTSRYGLLPFTGIYLRGDVPILLGIRVDVPTALLGSARFQPEAAFGFRPEDRATVLNANLVYPVRFGSNSGVLPFFGFGVGFHDVDAFESVLNLFIGVEYGFDFGVLFGELMTQDFSDFNRVIVGFRQDF